MHLCDLNIGDLVIIAETPAIYLGSVYAGLDSQRRALMKTIWYAPKMTQYLPSFPIYEADFMEGAWFTVINKI